MDRKNALLLQLSEEGAPEITVATVQYALKRGIESVYQLEESELLAEPLPDRMTPPRSIEDAADDALFERIRTGSTEAFAAFYDRHSRLLYAVALRILGDAHEAEDVLHDPLNRFAHLLALPVTVTLFLFGLTRGAVDVTAFGTLTPRILAALWLGKPLGLLAGALIGLRLSGRPLPKGVSFVDLGLIALLSGIGLTVPLLALDTALPAGLPADQVRAGLAASLAFGLLAVALARLFHHTRA
jgi:hypothetical protein